MQLLIAVAIFLLLQYTYAPADLEWALCFHLICPAVPVFVPSQHRRAALAVAQHAVRADKSIPVLTWTRPQAGESILVQKWNSPQGGQVPYTNAVARHQMTVSGLQLSRFSKSCVFL